MVLSHLMSGQVLEFLPLNTWTENLLYGAVRVDVKYIFYTKLENGVNKKQLLESKKDNNSVNDSRITRVQNMTNVHDNEMSLYSSCSSGKGSVFSEERARSGTGNEHKTEPRPPSPPIIIYI